MTVRNFKRTLLTIPVFALLTAVFGLKGYAAPDADYTNTNTGYVAIIDDSADLLTDSEEADVLAQMIYITEYASVAFKSTDNARGMSSKQYAEDYLHELFGTDSGTVFLIDMDNRMVYIYSDGSAYGKITVANANTITDNVYSYASRKDYAGCAKEAFAEMYAILDGRRIARPMKYIGNALLALLLALFINYLLALVFSKVRKQRNAEIAQNAFVAAEGSAPVAVHTNTTKRYNPPSSSSGGGGGSRGGGGGGGHSGGGGGHSF